MKNCFNAAIFPVLIAGFTATVVAQKPYFQQEVNYKIAVALDDTKHILNGNIGIEYINNSPDALNEIWMHLWPNAFKNRRSAYCKQELEGGNSRLYFAPPEDLGYFKNLDFAVDGQKAEWKIDKNNPDIALLKLPRALAPGSRITITTPFLLKIPASFSRLGHVDASYQITQWFPKPAVYDNKGWHAMPYLGQGEFYSEFGAFEVSITLPDNYVVGATGVLQTPSEIAFLQQKEAETKQKLGKTADLKNVPFPASSAVLKTIQYKAEKVHDFAWFADKRFNVLKDTARLASGRTVDCWVLFTDEDFTLWQRGAFYTRRAVEYYSQAVGEYPYPHATAVHSALSAGGGMEYPMITVINNGGTAKALDEVITHEVGHNWFYGILASNERDHAFMDEGLNSYYEQRYMMQYYGGGSLADGMGLPRRLFNPREQGSLIENGYLMLARENEDLPPDTHSNDFTEIAYGLQVYMKPAMCMAWLEKAVGQEKLDAAMQDYFRRWQFHHPYSEDLQASFLASGLDAGWFFQTMQSSKKTDYALTKVIRSGEGYELSIENRKSLNAPFPVTALKDGAPLETKWYPVSGQAKQKLFFPRADADAFVLDYEHATLDLHRKNNTRRVRGLFPGIEPFQIKNIAAIENPSQTTLGVLPWVSWNKYDQTTVGLILYNSPFPPRKFQYYLLPAYAFGSKQLVGLADLRYKLYPGGLVPRVTIGLSAKSFHFAQNASDDLAKYVSPFDYNLRYKRLVPELRADLSSGDKTFSHALNFRVILLEKEAARIERDTMRPPNPEGARYLVYKGKTTNMASIYELRYEGVQKRLPNPFKFTAALETQAYTDVFERPANYLRGSLEWRQQWYFKPKKKLTARFFAGYFLQNTQRKRGVEPTAFALNPQGFNDYRFDQQFIGRSETSGFLARQLSQTEGGFKSAFGAPFGSIVGNSNNYIMSLNLKADLPQRLPLGIPIKPWFDIGWFDDATPIGQDRPRNEQLLWSGGLMLEFFKGGLEIYFPLANSKTLKDRYCEQSGGANSSALFCGGNYWKWISWSIRPGRFEPVSLIESLVR